MKKKRYSDEEIQRIRELSKFHCYDEIVTKTGRSIDSIRKVCWQYKIRPLRKTYHRVGHWDQKLVDELTVIYKSGNMTVGQIAKHFGVSSQNINAQIKRFKINIISAEERRAELLLIHKDNLICKKWVKPVD